MDFGYPQNLSPEILKLYITQEGFRSPFSSKSSDRPVPNATLQVTGAVGWRRDGLVYKKNEVFLDIVESVNLLMSSKGSVLRCDVTGKILMKCFLSGMPDLKLGLNDKLGLEKEAQLKARPTKSGKTIELDDVTFHQCVNLTRFNSEKTVSFVPPDGEFELMKETPTLSTRGVQFDHVTSMTDTIRQRIKTMDLNSEAYPTRQHFEDEPTKREKLAKESRAKQKYTHTSGSKSFARKEKEIENTVGRVPGLIEMFELTHTKKNGSFISEEAKKLMADAKEKLASCSGTSESSRECMIAMENKIYIEIIRKEYGGRVGGLGMIPSESCVCYHSESTEEVQKLREEVQENKKMVSQLQSQLAVVMKFIRQKMPDCNLGGSFHDPESSGVRCTSASSNRSTDS